jgi:hypothetical protein
MTEPTAHSHVLLNHRTTRTENDMGTSGYVNEELISEDGCPTDAALDHISNFTGTAEEMAVYVQSLMHNGRAQLEDFVDDFQRPGKRFILVTGGWSGCESVISALQGTIFHLAGWESSFRGGKHTYTFSKPQWEMPFEWGTPQAPPPDTPAYD